MLKWCERANSSTIAIPGITQLQYPGFVRKFARAYCVKIRGSQFSQLLRVARHQVFVDLP